MGGRRGGPRGGMPPPGAALPPGAPDSPPVARGQASQEPPIRLQLRLTNHGSELAEVEVTDFDSSLGNFVVFPRKMTLQPGESVDAEPVTSRLGAGSAEIPLTVGLRVNSQSEKRNLTLRVKATNASPASEAPR